MNNSKQLAKQCEVVLRQVFELTQSHEEPDFWREDFLNSAAVKLYSNVRMVTDAEELDDVLYVFLCKAISKTYQLQSMLMTSDEFEINQNNLAEDIQENIETIKSELIEMREDSGYEDWTWIRDQLLDDRHFEDDDTEIS